VKRAIVKVLFVRPAAKCSAMKTGRLEARKLTLEELRPAVARGRFATFITTPPSAPPLMTSPPLMFTIRSITRRRGVLRTRNLAPPV
jgi:hypothetical protein